MRYRKFGVAALIVSEYGRRDARHRGGLTLAPERTRRILEQTAVPHSYPQPRTFVWTRINAAGATLTSSATCRGGIQDNGFYGHGIVNTYAAVTR